MTYYVSGGTLNLTRPFTLAIDYTCSDNQTRNSLGTIHRTKHKTTNA